MNTVSGHWGQSYCLSDFSQVGNEGVSCHGSCAFSELVGEEMSINGGFVDFEVMSEHWLWVTGSVLLCPVYLFTLLPG